MKRLVGLFACGSAGYGLLEIFWRGYTHWSMILTGGVVFTTMAKLRNVLGRTTIFENCLAGTEMITITEFMVGQVVNIRHALNVWDYSKEKGNFCGQICMKYACLWFLLSGPAMLIAEKIDKLLKNRVKSSCVRQSEEV